MVTMGVKLSNILTLKVSIWLSAVQQGSLFWGTFDFESPAFKWGTDYQRPNLAWQDLIVYEMPVRSFTADASSGVGAGKQGTFQGITEKVSILSLQVMK